MRKIPIKDLIDQKFGRLTIINEVEPYISPQRIKFRKMLVRCICGNYKEILLSSLRYGLSQSCGCLHKEKLKKTPRNLKHGLHSHPLYKIWADMKQRCYNSNCKDYEYWGGKGIKICNKWINNPKKFIKWALKNGWKKGLLVDREDNDENYTPDNCRFVDAGLSQRNKRLLDSTNTSGFRGVSWHKRDKKWQSSICINSKIKHLGYFSSLRLAALRRDVEAFLLDDGRPLNFGR